MNNYSRRALSWRRTDRLPAISAVASTVGKATGDHRYLAGLWRNKLLAGLCWYPLLSLSDPRPDQRRYIAPTWSWASHPGKVLR